MLEQGTVDLMMEAGVGERLRRHGLVHHGIELRFNRRSYRIDLTELTGGKAITIYPQREVVKDLTDVRLAAGGQILFEVDEVSVRGFEGSRPTITFSENREPREVACDFIAGCDGSHGICRAAIPDRALTEFEKIYPFAWLGILAEAAPSSDELIYANHDRGFALHSMRSPELTRLYLQCAPDEDLALWPDDRIWDELHRRFATEAGWSLREGPIIQTRNHRDAELRVRANATRQALSRRRRRAYRAADRS